MDDDFIDIPTASKELGLSERQVWLLVKRRGIPRFTLPGRGKRVYIPRADATVLGKPSPDNDNLPRVSPVGRRADARPQEDMAMSHDVSGGIIAHPIREEKSSNVPEEQRRLGTLLRDARLASGI